MFCLNWKLQYTRTQIGFIFWNIKTTNWNSRWTLFANINWKVENPAFIPFSNMHTSVYAECSSFTITTRDCIYILHPLSLVLKQLKREEKTNKKRTQKYIFCSDQFEWKTKRKKYLPNSQSCIYIAPHHTLVYLVLYTGQTFIAYMYYVEPVLWYLYRIKLRFYYIS